MIPIRELRAHENTYHGFVKLVAGFAGVVLVLTGLVILLISPH